METKEEVTFGSIGSRTKGLPIESIEEAKEIEPTLSTIHQQANRQRRIMASSIAQSAKAWASDALARGTTFPYKCKFIEKFYDMGGVGPGYSRWSSDPMWMMDFLEAPKEVMALVIQYLREYGLKINVTKAEPVQHRFLIWKWTTQPHDDVIIEEV